jgi:hypothetical protein
MHTIRTHLGFRPSSLLYKLLLQDFLLFLFTLTFASLLSNWLCIFWEVLMIWGKEISFICIVNHVNTVNSVMIISKAIVVRPKYNVRLCILRASSTTLWASVSVFRFSFLHFLSCVCFTILSVHFSKPNKLLMRLNLTLLNFNLAVKSKRSIMHYSFKD